MRRHRAGVIVTSSLNIESAFPCGNATAIIGAMKSTQIVALAAVLLLAGTVAYLALRNPQPPVLPGNHDHVRFIDAERCLKCHGPGGSSPQTPNHSPRRDCLSCHGR